MFTDDFGVLDIDVLSLWSTVMLKRKSYLFDQCGIKYERRYPSGSGVKARVLTTRQRVGD